MIQPRSQAFAAATLDLVRHENFKLPNFSDTADFQKFSENSGKTLKISENGIGMNWCFHFQISTPKRCRATGLSLGRRRTKQRAQVGHSANQRQRPWLSACPVIQPWPNAELKLSWQQLRDSATIGMSLSNAVFRVFAVVHLPVTIWTRRTLLGKNSLHSQVSRYTAKILSFQWDSKDSSKTE